MRYLGQYLESSGPVPGRATRSRRRRLLVGYAVPAILSVCLAAGSALRLLPFDRLETFGFISGAWGVWLQVRESVWNWPVQLVSSAFYVVVFFQARLFADTSLNVVYIALYLLGWYWWLRGGEKHSELHIGRLSWTLGLVLTALGAAATAGLTVFLTSVRDAAPFLDALTTVMSLIALFMTGRKLFESWWVWIAVNLIYIGLYLYKDLALTAVLYAIFAVFSVVGLLNWWRLMTAGESEPGAAALQDR
jgi:nicotinamide mononucleotide transporter